MHESASETSVTVGASHEPWWADAVGYEVYIRSFADSNGDGVGDLPGLTSRIGHLHDLGVEVVWVTPFYPSPMADFGYDVADYCDIDPAFGTLEDFDALVAEIHRRDMRLVVDLVPNHTSDQHPWFRSAIGDPTSPYRDHYLWRDPAPDGGPPNNWRSHFGGPAWTLDDASGQYWCHLFLPEQPDLDWSNPAVHRAFRDIIAFWIDRGADGFRIDVAQGLAKDPLLRDNPIITDVPDDAPPRTRFRAMRHDHDLDQPANRDIFREWHDLTAPADVALLGEVYLDDASKVADYVRGDGLDLAFYFPTLHTTWDPTSLRDAIDAGLDHGGGRLCWVHSSHDDARAPSRFGGGAIGRQRALALLAYTAFLPGPVFLYQGDELGLENGRIPASAAADPVAVRNEDGSDGRDGVRTPIPWTPDAPNLGFTTGVPWLPLGTNHGSADTVAAQRDDPESHLHAVRELLAVRRRLRPELGPVERLELADHVLAVRRGDVVVALAVGAPVTLGSEVIGATPAVVHRIGAAAVDVGGGGDAGALTVGADSLAVVRVGRRP